MDAERRLALVARLRFLRETRLRFAEARRELSAIEAALRRVADGVYGTCTACGASIPAERLELLPATSHCIGCATDDPSEPRAVPDGRVRGEQVGFVTDEELGELLRSMLRAR
jgi:DksA/TraR C4-type zinc finger protein